MEKCPSCGRNNDKNHSACVHCGESLQKRGVKNSPSRKNKFILLIAVIALMIVSIVGYQSLAERNSEEAIIDQFLTALTNQDKDTLKELLVPKDSRIIINDDSLQSLLNMIAKNPSVHQDIESSLNKESLSNDLFTVRSNGKVYGLFTKYVIDTTGYVIEVKTIGEKTMVTLNDSELDFIENAGESAEFGPFLAGIYQLKSTTMVGNDSIEEEVSLNLFGAQSKVTLTFAKAEEAKKLIAQEKMKKEEAAAQEAAKKEAAQKEAAQKEVAAEKVIVKEVIREVPVGGDYYYVIPYSDSTYLTKSDLSGLSKSDLRIARNEIYARHGHIFKSKDLQNYFNAQVWYYPNSSYNGKLSEVEQYNVDLIKSFE